MNEQYLGNRSFCHVIAETLTNDGSVTNNWTAPNFDFFVRNIKVAIYHDTDEFIYVGHSSRDLISLELEDLSNGNSVFKSNPIDLLALDAIGMSDSFTGFMIPAGTILRYTIDHTKQNITSGDFRIQIILSGSIASVQKIAPIEQGFFNQVVKIDVPCGASNQAYINAPNYDLLIKNIYCYQLVSNSFVEKNSATKDITTLQLTRNHDGQTQIATSAIDISQWNEIAQHRNFQGFVVPAGKNINLNVQHTSNNVTSGTLSNYIVLTGRRLNDISEII